MLVGALVALVIAIPSFKPAQLIQILGISGVAIGFAFRDILQNFLAGILILLTEPFRLSDQIVVGAYEGTVEEIETRATSIRTYDGRRVVIPNSELFTLSVTVNTAFETRRLQYDVGIGYGDDIAHARAVIIEALGGVHGVLHEPAPEALVVDLAGSTVNIRARWWINPPRRTDVVRIDEALHAIKDALTAAGVDLPFPTQQILFHDQTERTDGDRARQREGWPAGPGPVPGPRSVAGTLLKRGLGDGGGRRAANEPERNLLRELGRRVKARLRNLWEKLRTSFWFVPTLMAAASAGLAFGTIRLDGSVLGRTVVASLGFLWSGGADGARSLLSTVASSMITVAGTVFSITIAALTLASGQFGPRLLRNFTRDLGNQLVLGTFVATFLYCLLVLRTVRGTQEGDFVPYLSVTSGVLLAAASIGVLIYFIHHIAASIQAENLIAVVGAELKRDIARLRAPASQPPADRAAEPPPAVPDRPACRVRAAQSGYLQAVDRDELVAAAAEGDLLVQVLRRPGDFVSCGDALLLAWGREELGGARAGRLRDAFSLDTRRTPTQDVRYGARQLTEIAARALSPGINDPFTAMGCTDWLADALAALARCPAPPAVRRDAAGRPRLIEDPVGFAEFAWLSFEPIRAYGAGSAVVIGHLLQALARLAEQVDRPELRAALLREAEMAATAARQALRTEADLRRVDDELDRVRAAAASRGPALAG